jgi:hypothetical protein
VINKDNCTPDPEIRKEACHLRYQAWLRRNHLISADTFAGSIISWLSDQTLFSFRAPWFMASRAKHARHTNRKPVIELNKLSVELPFFSQHDHPWKREMIHLVM